MTLSKKDQLISNHLGCPPEDVRYIFPKIYTFHAELSDNVTKIFNEDGGDVYNDRIYYGLSKLGTTSVVLRFSYDVYSQVSMSIFYAKKDSEALLSYKKPVVEKIPKRISERLLNFLNNDEYQKYGIRLNRGLVLSGRPGNGKTKILRYIQSLNPSESTYVTDTDLDKGFIDAKFQLFDDINMERFSPKHPAYNNMLSMFDSGDDPKIRVFATNEIVKDLSEAFLRPGRISEVIHIGDPILEDREVLFENFPVNLAAETEGMTYAEIQFLKICLIDSSFDVDNAWVKYNQRLENKQSSKLGFK